MTDDRFTLYDLEVTVEGDTASFVCRHRPGERFLVSGEEIRFPEGGTFSLYALAALLPLLPAKERPTDPNDWMTTDALVACPDPNCGARFRIRRTARRTFRHGECTVVPLGAADASDSTDLPEEPGRTPDSSPNTKKGDFS